MRGPFVVWGVERREDHVELDAGPTGYRVVYGHVWGDALANPDGALVVSEKLFGLLRALYVPHLDAHPVELEGAPAPYFELAPLGLVASLTDVPADRQIFRVADRAGSIFFRRTLVETLATLGFVGPEWHEIA